MHLLIGFPAPRLYSKEMSMPKEEQSSYELLEAQAHVWNHIFKFINTMSLNCAVELGIPDIIHRHGKPMTLVQLANALPVTKAKSHHISRLMRVLLRSQFFVKVRISEEEGDGYWLTPSSCLLLRDGHLCQTPLLQVVVDGIMQEPWHYLSEWLSSHRSGCTAFGMAHGMEFWEYAEWVPRLNHSFNEAMASDSGLVNHVVLGNFYDVLEGFESLVDVGGGTGATAKAVAGAFPNMTCIVLDLPHVVAGLKGTANLSYVGGDMFEAIPRADAVLLKCVLHDWDDEDGVRILKKCKEAIASSKAKGGKLIIIDVVLNDHVRGGDDEATEDQLLHDMAMMTYLNGKERTEKEWARIFDNAGFTRYVIRYALGVRSLLEVYP